jgi:hypothetical protein
VLVKNEVYRRNNRPKFFALNGSWVVNSKREQKRVVV